MQVYSWEARTVRGELRRGEQEAPDEATLRRQLRRRSLKGIEIRKKPEDLLQKIPFFKQRVKEKERVLFTRQFSTMISAGLPLVQCLDVLSSQGKNQTFVGVIRKIKGDIEGGYTLSEALKRHPKIFDEFFVNLISAGEAGGVLDTVLQRLSTHLEKTMKLRARVKGAMIYPASVLAISLTVVALMLLKVIPVFQRMFENMGKALPAPTQFLIDLSRFTQSYFFYLAGGMALLVFAFARYYRTQGGRAVVDAFLLKAPVFGPFLKKVAVAKFSRTLSTMMSSGVPILEGLDIVSKAAGNKVIEAALQKTKNGIREGRTISEPLMETGVFPPLVVQMIAVGENTGALDSMLAKIADFYDDEVDTALSAITSLLEPVLMIFLGGIVGGMIIAMYLPIFRLAAGV